jgi:hypothetical protein
MMQRLQSDVVALATAGLVLAGAKPA